MTHVAKRARGQMAYHSGLSAENRIAADYERRGFSVARRRWRGGGDGGGEIDLITRNDDILVFVEVKQARDFATAAQRLSRSQMQRICISAEQFLGGEPDCLLTNMRIDVALVDGTGQFEIIENAFGAC